MSTFLSVYHENLRDLSTEELMTRLECYQLDRLELMDEPATDVTVSSIEYLEYRQNLLLEELTRRKRLIIRFPDDARAPRWPDRSSERYQKRIALADELKRLWPIERYCRDVLHLELMATNRTQRRWKACCPFHPDANPSFVVYGDDNRAWCFGCNQGGDIFDLAGLVHGLTRFEDQLRTLAKLTMSTESGDAKTGGRESA